MKHNSLAVIGTVAILAQMTAGCNSEQRLAEMASRSMELQAQQNARTAEAQKDISAGARQLVEADAAARQETLAIQRELQQQHAELGAQRDSLEKDRRQIASQRYVHPIIATAITQVGLALACLLPLVICWQLLKVRSEPVDDREIAEVLLNDLMTSEPVLLIPSGSPPGIEQHPDRGSPDVPELPNHEPKS